ncbi:transcriptional activator, Rgg/GadR/MutR family, C- domain-containing protein [Enterococcus casseliflavus]|jgi:Rgg/GadR/MutR family transcriptional activator|uniref:helix-turn-helix domain-containing protein n=1 Tax=Enterococcus casseliflavus TaxID=37734 RepID=UPI000E07D267|nr:Rgg/GadR/MutR family transcriptional regulator [Enterococcus casseliflavus]GEB28723.1 MutR family transcriptional regulator [Enterococcus casseliflavus]STP32853.1 transcriptional activator, Rgg/GadR/MutR family, C- domain-containing protein [Enterococcus casseliflavus]
MKFGATIRKIRKAKNFTQSEVSSEIITLSYYSRIERDISEPTISVFLQILHRLNMDFDEFMFIHNDYNETLVDQLWFNLSELYHSGDVTNLKKQKELFLKKPDKYAFLIDIINLYISRLANKRIEVKNIDSIVDKLLSIESWTSSEVKLFTTLMDILPIDTLILLTDHILKRNNLYMRSKGFNSPYSKILINSILLCIDANYLEKAEIYLSMFNDRLVTRDFYGRSMHMYLEGLLLISNGEINKGKQRVSDFFSICHLLKIDDFADKYKVFSDQIIDSH